MIVRHEYFGNLIWSDKENSYFVPKDLEVNKKVDELLTDKQMVDNDITKELLALGFDTNVREIFSDNKNSLSAPLEYYFDYTNECNLRCKHCYNRESINNLHTMTNEEIVKIIKDMYECGIMRIHLAGGEPTLFPDKLRTYMETANKYGIVSSMSSNGMLITEEIFDIIVKNNVTSFTVSLESADEEKNAQIRGRGVLEKSKEGIRRLAKWRQERGGNFIITVKMSYDVNCTEAEFEEMILLAIELNVDMLKLINPERCIFHEKGHYSNVAEKYYKNLELINKLVEKYKEKILITTVNSPVNYCTSVGLPNMKGCIGAQELIAINSDGSVTPCLMNKYDLGNIFEVLFDVDVKETKGFQIKLVK